MSHNLGKEKVNYLLWQLSIPAILGMLSSAIFNIVDRIFVGKINSLALTAVGITMPIQIFQMAFILLIGIGSSSLISIKLGEGKKEEAEDTLYLAFKYIILFLIGFAILFLLFLDPILNLLAVSKDVLPYAKIYIIIIIVGAIIGIPGYCLNNSLRAIGQAKVSMKIIVITSILNIILDPIFIFIFKLGIAGAAIATVLSQTVLTVYVVYAFVKRTDFLIHLKRRKVTKERVLLKELLKMGMPSFYVQIFATIVNMIINYSLLLVGTDMDIAAVTIMSSIFSFYHMVVVGIVQGNNTICGYNWGAKQYGRVKKSLELSLFYSFILSFALFAVIQLFPHLLVDIFTDDIELSRITATGIKLYLSMIPLVGIQIVSSQYYQAVGKATKSSVLSFLRYGIIIIPAIILLAPKWKVTGIYFSNALSDGIASIISIGYILFEIKRLKQLEDERLIENP
ncbi:MATE family efflux transporter [Clostridium sp. Marseille-P299]|uniref:MATE family efflux transporter n=1 Tax=Clostridium sp. Marseille-P299 TaxID=1805477 RepID=UPI00082989C0|nr:MATE family efflux transporter [Clostridium sp. Marseille-P299]